MKSDKAAISPDLSFYMRFNQFWPIAFLFGLPRVIRFLVAGGTATAFNLVFLYFLTDILGIWYLASTTIAFIFTFFLSFTLQKFFAFQDNASSKILRQMPLYLLIAVGNLLINALLMYGLVGYLDMYYLLAQIITSALISIESFFVYRHIIFRE
jgi:putative flippase GtrA